MDRFDANDGRDDRILEAVIGFAEIFLHGLGIEAPCDLLCGGDREVVSGGLNETPTLKFVLERFALCYGALQDRVGVAECVGQRRISKVVKAGCGRNIGSLWP